MSVITQYPAIWCIMYLEDTLTGLKMHKVVSASLSGEWRVSSPIMQADSIGEAYRVITEYATEYCLDRLNEACIGTVARIVDLICENPEVVSGRYVAKAVPMADIINKF